RVGELLVLRARLRELIARLHELLLENRDLAGRVRQPTTEKADLLLDELHLRTELVDLLVVLLRLVGHLFTSSGHHPSLALAPDVTVEGPPICVSTASPTGRLRTRTRDTRNRSGRTWDQAS